MSAIILSGRYQIISELGRGGFGKTYLAEDRQLPGNPRCVVKQLKPLNKDPLLLKTARRLFDTEAEVLYKLGNHDQIPRLFAHFEENQEFYLVQEYIEGHSLSEELAPERHFDEPEVVELLQGILEVLEFVHKQGVIHRDIKPSNLIRRKSDNKIVLIDFGAVKQISTQTVTSPGHTAMTIAIGSPGYVANEQLAGHPRFSSDIYAVGMIGIQALTGLFPKQLQDPKTSEIIWREKVKVSPGLAYVLDKMVRYDFRDRYDSASSVIADLKNLSSYTSGIIGSVSVSKSSRNTMTYERKTTQRQNSTKYSAKPANEKTNLKVQPQREKAHLSQNNLFWLLAIALLGLVTAQIHSYWQIRFFLNSQSNSTISEVKTPSPSTQIEEAKPSPEPSVSADVTPTPTASPQINEAKPSEKSPEVYVLKTPSPATPVAQEQPQIQTQVPQDSLQQTAQSAQSEAQTMIGLIHRNQLLYYVENNRFASNWQALGLDVQSKSESYNYRIIVADQNKTMVTATAKKPGLKSYMGAVFIQGTAPINKICETNSPSSTPPVIPAFNGKNVQCPNGSSESSGIF